MRTSPNRRTLVILTFAAIAAATSGRDLQAAIIVLDDFTGPGTVSPGNATNNWPLTQTVFSPEVTNVQESSTPGVYTGYRTHGVQRGSQYKAQIFGFGDSATYSISNAAPNSFLNYQSTTGGSASLTLTYGGAVPFGTNDDFRLPPAGAVLTLNFLALSLPANQTLTIQATALQETKPNFYGGNGAFVDVATPGAQSVSIPIPDAFVASHPALDSIQVQFYPPNGASFQLDSITLSVVPEPGPLAAILAIPLLARRVRARATT